jgi:trans-aconitate methyltransferase
MVSSLTVSQDIAPTDKMFEGNFEHYFGVGESALKIISAAIALADIPAPTRILDFGAGAGRVTRWLVAAFPDAEVHACDVRDVDMDFLRDTFGLKAWPISPDLDELAVAETYDLIWVGSVVTHLAVDGTRQLAETLLAALNPGGLLLLTFHGRHAVERRDAGINEYIHDEAWQQIVRQYRGLGYGYADYREMPNYGISLNSTAWMAGFVATLPSARLALMAERVWDDHHDVAAIQRTA